MSPREMPVAKRFPWDTVKGWAVTSRADGTLLIEPDYIDPYRGPDEGGGPGVMTRLALADWCLNRLCKQSRDARNTRQVKSDQPTGHTE